MTSKKDNSSDKKIKDLSQNLKKHKDDLDDLKRCSENFRFLAENAYDGILVASGKDGNIVYWNKTMAHMLRYNLSEIYDLTIKDIIYPSEKKRLLKYYSERIKNKKFKKKYETCFISKDKKKIDIELTASMIIWNNKPSDFIIVRDITEKKKLLQKLESSEERLSSLLDHIPIAVYSGIPDKKGTTTLISKRWKKWTGVSPEDMYKDPHSWIKCIHPDDKKRVLRSYISSWEKKKDFFIEYQLIHKKTKKVTYVLDHGSPVKDKKGNLIRYDGIVKDITERKKAEQRLKHSEEKLRTLIEQANDSIFLHDFEGNFLDVNQKACKTLGYTKKELLRLKVKDIDPDSIVRGDKRLLWKKLFSKKTFETRHKKRSGEIIPVEVTIGEIKYNDNKQILAIVRDISKRKKSELSLKESEAKVKEIIKNSPIPQFVIDKDHKVIFWNKAIEKLTGISSKKMLGRKDTWKVFYPKKRPVMADLIVDQKLLDIPRWYPEKFKRSKLIKGAYSAIDFFPKLNKKGLWLNFNASPLKDIDGNIVAAIETFEDITEKKQSEEKIKESEERFRSLFEYSPFGILLCKAIRDKKRKMIDFLHLLGNNSVESETGFRLKYFIGKRALEISRSKEVKDVIKNYSKMLSSHKPIDYVQYFKLYDKFLQVTAFPLGDDYFILNFIDITEKKKAEKDLKKAYEELKQIDELKSIAIRDATHELKNPLAKINMVSDLLKEEIAYSDPDKLKISNYIDILLNNAQLSLDHVNSVVRLSKIQEMKDVKKQYIDISFLIDKVLSSLRPSAELKDIKIISHINTLSKIRCNKELISELFKNLIENAIKFTEKGNIKISAKKINKSIKFVIQDTGIGLSKEDIKRLFTPFFKKDPSTKGLGVGLSICKKAVDLHDGTIDIESQLGKGSKFTITLPVKRLK